MQLHAFVSGRVQGVGFRANAEWMARRYHLRGWVRNLEDGRVELKAEGSKAELEHLLQWLHQGPRYAHVDHVEFLWSEHEEQLDDFLIEDLP